MSTLYQYLNFLHDSNPGPGVIDTMAYNTQSVWQIDDRATGKMRMRVCVNRVYVLCLFLINIITIPNPNFPKVHPDVHWMWHEPRLTKINRIFSTQPGKTGEIKWSTLSNCSPIENASCSITATAEPNKYFFMHLQEHWWSHWEFWRRKWVNTFCVINF